MWGSVGGGGGLGVRLDVNEELKYLRKLKKNRIFFWGVGSGRGSGWGSQGGCERRIEVFEKIHKTKIWGGGGGGGFGGVWVGGGCSGWGVRVDVNEELKFL